MPITPRQAQMTHASPEFQHGSRTSQNGERQTCQHQQTRDCPVYVEQTVAAYPPERAFN